PGSADVPFRLVTPGPVMIPLVQFRLPVTVRVPGPEIVPDWNVSAPTWREAPALAVSVPPLSSRLATDGLSEAAARVLSVATVTVPAPVVDPPARVYVLTMLSVVVAARVNVPVLVPPPVRASVPVCTSVVPVLLN